MLDNLFDSIKGEVMDTIASKAGISADQAEKALPLAQESIQTGLMEQVKGGNISGLMDMFNSSEDNLLQNSIFGGIKQNFLSMITSKLGLPDAVAGLVANVGLEKIFGMISGKAKGDDGQVSQEGLMSTLGLDSGGIGDIAKDMLKGKLGGLGKNLFG